MKALLIQFDPDRRGTDGLPYAELTCNGGISISGVTSGRVSMVGNQNKLDTKALRKLLLDLSNLVEVV